MKTAEIALLALILASLIGWLYLMQNSWMVSTVSRIQELEKEKARLKRENAQLLTQIAELEEPSRLQARAKELGFVPPERTEYVIVHYRPAPPSLLPTEEAPMAEKGDLRHRLRELFLRFSLKLREFHRRTMQ